MIRATFLLTLALSLATGESALLICRAVCDRAAEADADACRHAPAAPVSVTNGADCLGIGLPATATLRVELNRPGSHEAMPVADPSESLIAAFGRPFAPTTSLRVGSPPRVVALRI